MTNNMPAIQATNISKTYPGTTTKALDNVTLSIKQGDFYGLLGPNGAGKTTLISIITSLITKNEGSIAVCGFDLDKDPEKAKTSLGIVPQEFNFSIFEKVQNIIYNQAGYHGLTRNEVKDKVKETLTRLGLWEKRNSAARTLSGGMKRRLMIARALVHDPKVLILDEPTAGVDIELRRDMWEYLNDLNKKGLTILLTTHYLEEAEELCNNLAIINHGKVIKQGDKASLLYDLKQRTFVFDFKDAVGPELKEVFTNFSPKIVNHNSLEVTVDNGQASVSDLVNMAHKAGGTINDMRNKNNRLEELFLHLIQSSN